MTRMMKKLWEEEWGQDLTEYALVLLLVALTLIASMTSLGGAISKAFSTAASNVTAAT
jgi:Flp pilus assembly pilin Flp